MRLLLERLAAHALPLEKADAHLLVELIREGWKALSAMRGVRCRYGGEGEGRCVPAKWKGPDWAERDRTCSRCPVYQLALSERRQGT